jgi:hypothetical protein
MPAQTRVTAKGHVAVEEARRAAATEGAGGWDENPMQDMTVATQTALSATKDAGPLIAGRVTDAERMLNEVMKFEQVADRLATAVERGDMDREQARKQADRELRKSAGDIRGRWNMLTAHTQGLPQVLEMRAFPDPGRDPNSAEVKADIERKLGRKTDKVSDLLPAIVDLAHDALNRNDLAMVSHLAGDYGQTLITNAMSGAGASDRDRKEAIGEVRRAIIDATASTGKLTETQKTAIGQLQRMDDLNDAVTSAVFLASLRFDEAFKRLPWAEGESARAEQDPDRNPFYADPMRGR